MEVYDTIIIGAGVAGACSAYFLRREGERVLVLERHQIASGGSGAAGAFVSPKIGKGSPLQSLTNEAFEFAKDFYLAYFGDYYHQTGVIRIPKDADDAEKFDDYQTSISNRYKIHSLSQLKEMNINTLFESFFFSDAGVCDAKPLCEALLDGVDFKSIEVKQISYCDGFWRAEGFYAKNIILATGYENTLADVSYMGVSGLWGTRGDFRSNLSLNVSLHQSMSISANINGVIKLGATHEKEIKKSTLCDDNKALLLQQKALALVDTSDMQLLKSYCGMRAGSRDYFPLVGKVINVAYMLENFPTLATGAKPPLHYRDGLYICNGFGGRGFVFGPLMGYQLARLIVHGEMVDSAINPDRLFYKWCRHKKER